MNKKEIVKEITFDLPENLECAYIKSKFSYISEKVEELKQKDEYKDYLFKSFDFIDSNYKSFKLTFILENIEFNLNKEEKAS